ncbi:hypothetical protein GPY51_24210 [Photorhabdus laumondii subsp. laumondii]|uniref:Transposase, IS1 family n=2 Tax=Photorhabdus laumondii subsp. laumondii TaxID=141679 RepID=Q7MZ59_PHOLL|nr:MULTISPECIES: transposase [Photorhabdus]AXG44656.1 hypothetical protein PluDJC_21975 [Photorhabdus laumondii subsp. laumondii]AXG49292.1 hypothetical protein PluTT01m_22685 [Photorhabdus laumondii subsp. laumondii]MCC8390879.1 IS1 family transposase [Photorhabdus laumondii]MCC8415652.1 IS1 family transposase [Photorhabdus laumondii]MCZ1250938.1 hypothetical protein [Photorhabdus laumondii subsp. laumondii]
METLEVKCRFCQQTEFVKKHSKGDADHQRYRCFSCNQIFQLEYAYRACHCSYIWNEKTFRKLLKKLASFNVVFWCTDNFKTYNLLPKSQHRAGKIFTQHIERENLMRTRIKRLNV